MVREIEIGLLEMDNQSSTLLQRAIKHLHHLAELIDDPFAYDSHKFRTEHEQLDYDFVHFVEDFRKNRKEVFTITEHLINKEEMVRRLNLVSK